MISEDHIGPSLEAHEAALLDQLITKLTELKSGPIVAEVRSGYDAKGGIRNTRTIAVAAWPVLNFP